MVFTGTLRSACKSLKAPVKAQSSVVHHAAKGCTELIRSAAASAPGDAAPTKGTVTANTESLSNFTSIRSPIVKPFVQGCTRPATSALRTSCCHRTPSIHRLPRRSPPRPSPSSSALHFPLESFKLLLLFPQAWNVKFALYFRCLFAQKRTVQASSPQDLSNHSFRTVIDLAHLEQRLGNDPLCS